MKHKMKESKIQIPERTHGWDSGAGAQTSEMQKDVDKGRTWTYASEEMWYPKLGRSKSTKF